LGVKIGIAGLGLSMSGLGEGGATSMRAYRTGALRLPGSIAVIGAFDGVHLGHQKVIGGAVGASRSLAVPAVVYTFDPPPKALFSGAKVLTDIHEKLRRLSLLGPDYTIVASFDRDYSTRPPEDFVDELMLLNPIEVWVGSDFRFGAQRRGDVEMLSWRFQVRLVDAVPCSRGEAISSTRIRDLIAKGDELGAQSLLGWHTPAPARTAIVRSAFSGRAAAGNEQVDLAAA
jgi:riboflavin kinase/FMN adenylyltransferase